jgi:hypothetical protein
MRVVLMEDTMRRADTAVRWAGLGLLAALGMVGCSTAASDVPERMGRGPRAEEMFYARVAMQNDREPNFDEKRQFKDQMDEKVFKYLREHPEVEQKVYYSEFRFWRQVSEGNTPDEVRTLLDEPIERTIDPARMGALAKAQWPEVRTKAKEAWLYPLGWILYFDDTGVVSMLRRSQPGFFLTE